jgi:hypothetical protein
VGSASRSHTSAHIPWGSSAFLHRKACPACPASTATKSMTMDFGSFGLFPEGRRIPSHRNDFILRDDSLAAAGEATTTQMRMIGLERLWHIDNRRRISNVMIAEIHEAIGSLCRAKSLTTTHALPLYRQRDVIGPYRGLWWSSSWRGGQNDPVSRRTAPRT